MCIFCSIANNEIPSYKIYEDDKVLAMLDISQATVGHTLVLPKKHYQDIFEIDEKTLTHLTKIVKKIVDHYKKVIPNLEGINILNNNGDKAGQTVKHFHIHIIPRYKDDDVTDMKLIDHSESVDYSAIQERIKL